MKSILAIIWDVNGKPVQNARVRLNVATDTWINVSTDEQGYADFTVDDSLQNTQFEIYAEGYVAYGTSINLGLVGNLQIRVGMPPDPNRNMDILLPGLEPIAVPKPPVQTGPITISGTNFIRDGKRFVFTGLDYFSALRHVIDGRDIGPMIQESRTIGFNLWRVFMMGSANQNGFLNLFPQNEPTYHDSVIKLCETLNSNGITLLSTCYVDNQDVKLGSSFWTDLNSILQSYSVLSSGGNEWSKNGFYPGDLSTAVATTWSRGSDVGDVAPFKPYGLFAEFHPRRDYPKSLDDSVASSTFIQYNLGCNVPLIIDEPPRMGWDGSGDVYWDPNIVWKFARNYATMCGGAVFHNRKTMDGNLMDDLTKECAIAWTEGMKNYGR